jgi:transglutaminase-like putative cysteine protease
LFGFLIAIQFLEIIVKIRAGYDIAFQCPQAVPMVLMLTTHPERDGDILCDQSMRFSPGVAARDYFDPFGNICTRLVAPPGLLEVRSEFVVQDTGLPDEVCPSAQQWDVGALPAEALPFLLASRYCDTEKLSNLAWSLFGGIQGGWQRAQAICDMPTTASSSDIIMPAEIAPRPKATRSAAASAGTSRTSRSRFPAA